MSANLIGLEQVESFSLLGHVEVPLTENVVSQAMHWLISLDWIDVIQEAESSQ